MAVAASAAPSAAAPSAAEPADPAASVAAATATRTIDPARRPETTDRPQQSREPIAADVADAPLPGAESGRIDDGEAGDSALRMGLRGALFVPKVALNLVLSPAWLSAWAYERYHLNDLYYRVFFNDARTIGLVPTASFDSGFGISAGARFVDRDVFGAQEHLSISAAGGGRYHQAYTAEFRTGHRLRGVELEVDARYEQRPRDPFYGIGNVDDTARPAAPVDPITEPIAVETRYRERIARIAGVVDVPLIGSLHLRGASELTDRTFSPADTGVPIDAVYEPAMLVGYGGFRDVYSELELRYDGRRRFDRFEPRMFYSAGSLAAAFGGLTHRLDGAPDYWRYGVDLQHFIRLSAAPRVLAIRLRGEAVSGSRAVVPFSELPQLGGADELRGYPADRFRDRALALGSLEYEWDLSELVSTSLFVDAGRVYAQPSELGPDHLRVGYGLGFQTHTQDSFGFQGSIATSVDGGVFFSLSLNPIFGLDERVRRR